MSDLQCKYIAGLLKNVINTRSRGIFIMSARNQVFFERLSLNLVSSRRRLDSINDLKKINFGESVPKHSLLLLYWFANTIDVDDSDNMRLTFDVNRGDYGSHGYRNLEALLDPPPPGYDYYTIGNLYQDQFRLLPKYVVNPPREYAGNNCGRIIVRVKLQDGEQGEKTIDQVYITQHRSGHQGSSYDSRHTYRITPNLIRELRLFCVRENRLQLLHLKKQFKSRANDVQISCIKTKWPGYAGLGLLIFIAIEENSLPNFSNLIFVIVVVLVGMLVGMMLSKWDEEFITQLEHSKRVPTILY